MFWDSEKGPPTPTSWRWPTVPTGSNFSFFCRCSRILYLKCSIKRPFLAKKEKLQTVDWEDDNWQGKLPPQVLRKRKGRCKIPLPGFFFNNRLLLFSFCSLLSSLHWSCFCLFLHLFSWNVYLLRLSKILLPAQLTSVDYLITLLAFTVFALILSQRQKPRGVNSKEISYILTGFLFNRRPSCARRCWGLRQVLEETTSLLNNLHLLIMVSCSLDRSTYCRNICV